MLSMVGVGCSPERLRNRNVCSESMEKKLKECIGVLLNLLAFLGISNNTPIVERSMLFLLTTLGILETISVSADIPLSSRVPADAPASSKILAHSALLVSAASCEEEIKLKEKEEEKPKLLYTG